ncbi:hypothetical protein BGZ49_001931, partial [Haplosporangium sp. Z 27]
YLKFSATAAIAFAFCLPAEILVMIAASLDLKSLSSALRVFHRWNETLKRLWFSVAELDWHHPCFATHRGPYTSLPEMGPFSAYTKMLSWHSNSSLLMRHTSNILIRSLFPQISVSGLIDISTHMTNLTSVELHMDNLPRMSGFIHIEHLKWLDLNLLRLSVPDSQEYLFPAPTFAALFSKTTALKLVLPSRTRVLSIEDVCAADPRTIVYLEIGPQAVPLASNCQDLKEVVVS